jgi:hypothetical protein
VTSGIQEEFQPQGFSLSRMTVLLQPATQPAMSPPITVRFSVCAYARLQTQAMTSGLTISDVIRRLVKTGWAVHFDGTDVDMPLGTNIKLAEGLPGANGSAAVTVRQGAVQ